MDTRTSRVGVQSLMAIILIIAGASMASATEPTPGTHAAPSKATREKMAAVHEKMAACLRSDKSIAECHTEMMKTCQETMGKDGCPMMGMGGSMGMKGMHDQKGVQDHMMQNQSSSSADHDHEQK